MVGTRLGMCGVEYFAHPWEFGPRKTKELMLTGDSIGSRRPTSWAWSRKIFPRRRAGRQDAGVRPADCRAADGDRLLIKESVNQTVDNMGFYNALQACFSLHQINHAHWAEVHEDKMPAAKPEDGVPSWREAPPVVRAAPDKVRA